MTSLSDQIRVAAIYNPQNQTKTQLIESFVVRQNTFNNLFKAIKEAKMEVPEQHYLLLGRRGMGKTTLLLRLAYEIENDPELNQRLIPLVFNEEEYGIRRLFNLWERIIELLEQKSPEFHFGADERKRLSELHTDDDSYERALFDLLAAELKRTEKKAILFIDNFGDLSRKLTDEEAHRLRKILQTNPDIRIFAASALVLDSFFSYEHAFYEFFKVVELKGLNEKETRDLLLSLAEHYKKETVTNIVNQHPGRVEALRRITGGVIRTMVLLFEIFADDEDGNAFKDLEIVLDRLTPLYKHRMDDLSPQQQAIVEAIAQNWDALSVKEIAERTRLESKIISAQLQALEKNGVIEKRPTKTKNHLYLISERFFNIWYLMRNGRRSDEKRVLWLVKFFEDWCDEGMMKLRAELHRNALQKGNFEADAAYFYTLALVYTNKLSASDRHELLRDTRTYLMDKSPELASELIHSDLDKLYEGLSFWFGGQKEKAIIIFESVAHLILFDYNWDKLVESKTTFGAPNFWECLISGISNTIGYLFINLQAPDWKKAEACYKWTLASKSIGIPTISKLFPNVNPIEKSIVEAYSLLENSIKNTYSESFFGLGYIYTLYHIDIIKGMEYFEKSASAGNNNTKIIVMNIFFKQKVNKEIALKILDSISKNGENSINSKGLVTSSKILAWNNQIKSSKELIMKCLLDTTVSLNDLNEDFNDYFTLLLAKNEAPWLYTLFIGPEGEAAQLKDRFKPIYYAILKKINHPDFLRMGEELAQTVDEILAKADKMAVEYA